MQIYNCKTEIFYYSLATQHAVLILSNVKENSHATSKYHVSLSTDEPIGYLHLNAILS